MSLFSLEFIILLTVLFAVYYLVPRKWQWICLLAASMIFYAYSGIQNLLLIGITSLTTWGAGLYLRRVISDFQDRKAAPGLTREQKKELKARMLTKKRVILYGTLLLNFGILGYLKYWETLSGGIMRLLHMETAESGLGLLLPLGISFYTFQSAGYLLDQYKGSYEPEKNFARYLLFVSFFPQMIQGPINRFDQLEKQLLAEHAFEWARIKRALFFMLFGLLKKYAIANLLANAVALILDAPNAQMPGSVIVTGILMYSAQQYADFSGGIDLVWGIALLFGIEMAQNFRQPYFAVSLGDFWRRWHISLGAWMRDYVFYPFALTKPMQNLGKWATKHLGRQTGRVLSGCIGNILVFFLVGIWHGAQLHYVIWGLYNGLVIALAELCRPLFEKWIRRLPVSEASGGFHVFRIIRTFLIVNIGWYFDRIYDMGDCMLAFHNTLFYFGSAEFSGKMAGIMAEALPVKYLLIVLAAVVFVFVHSLLAEKHADVYELLCRSNIVVRWGVYYFMLILIQVSMSMAASSEAFMYAVF